jgi:hypothetical protein
MVRERKKKERLNIPRYTEIKVNKEIKSESVCKVQGRKGERNREKERDKICEWGVW